MLYFAQSFFGEIFRGFDLCSLGRGAENGVCLGAQRIRQAADERLLGTDNDEADFFPLRQ